MDALCDRNQVWIGGIMQHVEEAGVHSGDSACVLPPHSLGEEMLDQIRAATRDIALAIGVVGLLNVQYAIHAGELYVIEANPRASRTVPFVSKAVAVPLAKLACRIMLGETIESFGLPGERQGLGFGSHVSVKEAVLPFDRFEGSDALLGPEMRSTGEVMGIARDFPTAFAKAQAAAGVPLPREGTAFITVTDEDKTAAAGIAQTLHDNGFRILATRGTAQAIARMGVPVEPLNKLGEGSPHVLDWIERGEVDLVVNTPTGVGARSDGYEIRRAAVSPRHPLPDDAGRRCLGGPRDRPRPARRRARGAVPAGAAPRAARPRRTPATRRHPLPRGRRGVSWTRRSASPQRRLLEVAANESLGPYRLLRVLDPGGDCAPGQFAMLATEHGWGGGRRRAPVPGACPLGRPPHRRGVTLPARGRGSRHRRLCELQAGERVLAVGPLGRGFSAPEPGRRVLLVGGGVGIAPLMILQDRLGGSGAGAARLPRRRAGPRGGADARGPPGDRRRLRTAITAPSSSCSSTSSEEDSRRRSVPAARARCSRACGRCARAWGARPARPGGADGVRLRGLLRVRRAGPRRALPARVRRRPGDRRAAARAGRRLRRSAGVSVRFCGLELAHPIVNGSGTFDAVAAAEAFGEELLEDFPFAAYVSKTITLAPRAGNPPPRIWEVPAGMINSIGLPNKGLDGYLRR